MHDAGCAFVAGCQVDLAILVPGPAMDGAGMVSGVLRLYPKLIHVLTLLCLVLPRAGA